MTPCLLALDLAGKTGWARWREGMEAPRSGMVGLARATPGQTFASFRDWLLAELIGHEVTHLAIEAAFISEANPTAAARLYGLAAICDEISYRRRIHISRVTTFAWRKFFIGVPKAPATVSAKHRRAWLKEHTVAECVKRGMAVASDDEADAIGVLFFERARLFPRYGVEGDLGLVVNDPAELRRGRSKSLGVG
jgi:hypothetical protein